MNTDALIAELKSVDTLVADGIIDQLKGTEWKARIIAKFEGESIPALPEKQMPNDIAHLPGRMVGFVIKACGNINGARCAGIDDSQVHKELGAPRKQQKSSGAKSPQELMDNIPDMYK